MRIVVEIDEGTLRDVMKLTGERKKSPAMAKAIADYVRRRKAQELGRLLREGAFDYPSTNEEVEAREESGHGAR